MQGNDELLRLIFTSKHGVICLKQHRGNTAHITHVKTIEIIDIECVLGNLAGTQIEKKIALINPPCWICPRSGLCELQWGEFNLPL